MAEVVSSYTQDIIVTDDNPRSESSSKIIHDIVPGFSPNARVQIIPDRYTAIATALAQAKPLDVVLIAGKGHEDYQEIQGVRRPFSDLETVATLLAQRGKTMLVLLAAWLEHYASAFRVFQYLTLRGILGVLTALLLSLCLGPWMIRRLQHFQIGQVVRDDGPQSHLSKAGTPTMEAPL